MNKRWLLVFLAIPLGVWIMVALVFLVYGGCEGGLDFQYKNKALFLYKGEQVLSDSQLCDLNYRVETFRGYNFTKKEDEALLTKYEFYSISELDYLTKQPFSLWNFPFMRMMLRPEALTMYGFVTLTILCFAILKFEIIDLRSYSFKLWHLGNKQLKNGIAGRVLNIAEFKWPKNIEGMLAVRIWRISFRNGKWLLRSTWKAHTWQGKICLADKLPKEDNETGIHAYRFGATTTALDGDAHLYPVFGLCELRGQSVEHGDGIMRAEQCEIFALVLDKGYAHLAESLSVNYGIPVYLSEDNIEAYHALIFSEEGLHFLRHNAGVSKQLKEVANGNKSTSEEERKIARQSV